MRRYKTLFSLLLLSIVLIFTGNTLVHEEGPAEKKLVISFPQSLVEYNPLYTYSSTEAQLYTALYEGLVTYDPYTLKPTPAVAEKWEISSDKKVFTFTLRKDSYYWDGTNVTARDFRNSWLKILSPGNNAEYAFLLDIITGAEDYRNGTNTDPSMVGVKAIDDFTLRVELDVPAEHFLKILCHHSFVPVHPSFLDKREWTDLPSAPGNGPYYILKKQHDSLILVKNLLYWDEKNVEIPRIEILFTEDPEKTTDLFNTGSIHWATSSFSSDRVENKKHIVFSSSFATNYFFFNCRRKPWDNEDLRKAFLYAAPIEAVRNSSFLFYPASSLVPPIPDYPEVSAFRSRDLEKAAYHYQKSGIELTDEIVIKIPESFESARVASLLKEAWEKFFTVSVKINIVAYQKYYQELKSDDYTFATVSWIGDFPDPLTFLKMWTTGSTLNDSGFSNAQFDRAIRESLEMSGRKRYEFLSAAEQTLLDSAAVMPVSYSPSINLVNTDIISGWYPNPIDIHPFKYLRFRQGFLHPGLVLNTK